MNPSVDGSDSENQASDSHPGWVAFLTLVGVRELARTAFHEYDSALQQFKQHVQIAVGSKAIRDGAERHLIAERESVYLLNDSIYVHSHDIEALLQFLARVRTLLLRDGYLVQGAVARGALGKQDAFSSPTLKDEKQLLHRKLVMRGFTFGKDAASVYARHETLRAVAIRLEDVPDGEGRVQNVHVLQEERRLDPFLDLALVDADFIPTVVDKILEKVFMGQSSGTSLGTYLMPLLVNWIVSVPLAGPDTRSSDDVTEYLLDDSGLLRTLLNPRFSRHFQEIRGAEAVYFAAYERIRAADLEPYQGDIVRFFLGRKRMMAKARMCPETLLSTKSKTALLEAYARHVRPESAAEKAARAAVKRGISTA